MFNDINIEAKRSAEIERPDFGRILDSLQKLAAGSSDLAEKTLNLANGIKPMEEMKGEANLACLVDYLWSAIWKIESSHVRLERTINHLKRVVGA